MLKINIEQLPNFFNLSNLRNPLFPCNKRWECDSPNWGKTNHFSKHREGFPKFFPETFKIRLHTTGLLHPKVCRRDMLTTVVPLYSLKIPRQSSCVETEVFIRPLPPRH